MKNTKKLNNKGFSLVELIIVIAIMAVLAAALAPQLIKYIEKSRVSTDDASCDTIKSAFNAAIADDDIYGDCAAAGASVTATITAGSNGAAPTITGQGVPASLVSELQISLAQLKAPKATGKTTYTLSWSAANNDITNVTVVTS